MCHGMKVVREGQSGGKKGQVVEGGKADCVKVENGGKGCEEDSEASQIREVEGAKLFVNNVWETSEDKLEKA